VAVGIALEVAVDIACEVAVISCIATGLVVEGNFGAMAVR